MKANWLLLVLIYFISINISCSNKGQGDYNIDIFKRDSITELANAVEREDTAAIRQFIAKNPNSVNYQEPKFGKSLLHWSVLTNHYYATKSLLENGANANIQDFNNGITPVIYAANKFETSTYLRLLLQYNGDPNLVAKNDSTNILSTPLIAASSTRLESVKLLVDYGANVNYMGKNFRCALLSAIHFNKVDIVYYLIIKKNAIFNKPLGRTVDGKDIFITNLLRTWVFPLNSKEHKIKMEIVAYLKQRGIDYNTAPIPLHYFNNYSKDFLAQY